MVRELLERSEKSDPHKDIKGLREQCIIDILSSFTFYFFYMNKNEAKSIQIKLIDHHFSLKALGDPRERCFGFLSVHFPFLNSTQAK